MKTIAEITITPQSVVLNGKTIKQESLNELYRKFIGDYPKFFKMDGLSKLGFIGAELLLKDIDEKQKEEAAVILFNRSSSLATDRNYQKTLDKDNYFPSPAIFVYTLANIVTGEIAIRHKIYGETSFYILPEEDKEIIDKVVENAYLTSSPSFVLTGWVDYENTDNYIAKMKLVTK